MFLECSAVQIAQTLYVSDAFAPQRFCPLPIRSARM